MVLVAGLDRVDQWVWLQNGARATCHTRGDYRLETTVRTFSNDVGIN